MLQLGAGVKVYTVATQGLRGCKTPWHRAMRLCLALPRGRGKQPPGIQPALVWRPKKGPGTEKTRAVVSNAHT